MDKKKKLAPPTAKTYSNVRNNWSKDRNAFVAMQRNFFVMFSIVAMVGIVVAMIVIKSMVEKNAIEPYVISVNNTDKMPIAIQSQSVKEYADANAPVIEYFLIKYVKAREGYDPGTFKYDNSTVTRVMSTSDIYQMFRKTVVLDEKNNPEKIFGNNGRVEVVIKNIAHNAKESVANIRIAKKVTSGDGEGRSMMNFQIKVHYVLDTKDMTAGELQINPLGIKVDTYQLTEEKVVTIEEEDLE